MFRLSLVAAAAIVLASFTASPARAQFGGRGMQLPPAVVNIMLLRSDEVQKELKLGEDQTKAIGDLASQMMSDAMEVMSGLQDLSAEERKQELPNIMKMMNEKGKELQAKVDKVLDPKQLSRMKELSLQRRDVAALEDDEVVGALKLSDEQKKKLDTVRDEAGKKQQEIMEGLLSGGGGDQQQMRAKMQELQKELGGKALAVLTPEQKEQFEKMKGAKFNFPRGRGGFPF